MNKIENGFANMFLNFKFIKNNILVFITYFVILFSVFTNIIKNKNTTLETSKIRKIESSIISPILII